jgi:hypothetical protein
LRAILLVTDAIYTKTKRHIGKVRALARDDYLCLLLTPHGPTDYDVARLERELGVRVFQVKSSDDLDRTLSSIAGIAGEIAVVSLNHDGLLPALAVAHFLGRPPRAGILEACNKLITRARCSDDKNLALAHLSAGAGDQLPKRAPFGPGPYIIKPCLGTSSQQVFLLQSWRAVRDFLARHPAPSIHINPWVEAALDWKGFPTKAWIVERYISGTEFSIDGWITGSQCKAVVQHKLQTVKSPFFGDGLTVSPPVPACDLSPYDDALELKEDVLKVFARQVLKAIGLSKGVFHIEARKSPRQDQVQLIEVNPRAPGGSLWKSAMLRTGCDLELKDAALQIDRPYAGEGIVPAAHVMHYPYYAMRSGKLLSWGMLGNDCLPGLPNLCIDKAANLGDTFDLENECGEAYLAFAVSHDETLQGLLEQAKTLRAFGEPIIG